MPRKRNKTSRPLPRLSGRLKVVGVGLLFVGIGLFLFPMVYRQTKNNPKLLMVARAPGVATVSAEPIKIDSKLLADKPQVELPARVVIPTVGIDLPVVEAPVINGYWQLSDNSASHGVGSANPGENGNIVVFAHARDGLFMTLRNTKKDDTIYVLSQDRWFRYKVTDYKLVDPDAVETIAPTTEETLTLYTCDGFLDAKRLIVVAKPLR